MSDFIPEDVMVDILSRLPTKSLIRFRSVSKLWNSLITSPNFINSHLNQSLTNPKNSYDNLPLVIVRQCIKSPPPQEIKLEHYKLFIDAGEEGTNTFDEFQEIPFPIRSRRLHFYFLMGYVKGLFCVFEQDSFFLWNPSIRKTISLPKPGITKKTHGSLVDFIGFGFDLQSNDYKLVRVVNLCGTKPSEMVAVPLVEIYSLNAGLWKVSCGAGDSFPPGFSIMYCRGRSPSTCLNGAIHWAAEPRGHLNDRLVLSFDLSDEVFKTIPFPNDLLRGRFDIEASVFGGLLSLLCHDNSDRANKSCSIWIMKEYGVVDSWYKYVKVDLTGGITGTIGIRKNGHILLEGDKPRHWELSSYDPWNKEIKKLGINGTIGHFSVDTYEENLILLDKIDVPVSRRGWSRKRPDRLILDQSIHARIEAQEVATDAKRVKLEYTVLKETVEGKIGVAREALAKMGPQQLAELHAKLQTNFPKFLGQGNQVAEKLSDSPILGRGENVKGNHLNGSTSSGQGTRDEDLENLGFWRNEKQYWRNEKAAYAHWLEKISEWDQILQAILT